ncbi:MAG: KH domain-containing protein [Limisphaerales bacterium]
MRAFLESVVKGMVAYPDEVRINPVDRKGETVYEIQVHPSDVGRLVGRRGNTINAIRTLLTAGGARKGLRCSLELLDERSDDRDRDWDRDRDRDRDRGREAGQGRGHVRSDGDEGDRGRSLGFGGGTESELGPGEAP